MMSRILSAHALGFLKGSIRYLSAGHLPRKDHWIDTTFPSYGVALVLDGEGEFEVSQESRQAVGPFLFAVHPGLRARYGPRHGTTWHERFVAFDGPRVREWGKSGLLPPHCAPMPLSQTCAEEAAIFHERILDDLSRADSLRIDLARTEAERWLLLLRHGADRPDLERPAVSRIAPLLAEWEANPPSSVNLAVCARKCGMSYPHWRAEFAKLAGLPPYKYLLSLRLQRAGRMLLEGALSIKEASFACGFRNVETFHRAFRMHYGLTPGAYCRQALALKSPRGYAGV